MPAMIPIEYLVTACGSLVAGWLLCWALGRPSAKRKRRNQADPRDSNIRSLEAELRISKADTMKLKLQREDGLKKLVEIEGSVKSFEVSATEKANKIAELQKQLKESVAKTRELRLELTDRVTENVKAEVMLRDAETELELVRASTDMMDSGELDYDPSHRKEG